MDTQPNRLNYFLAGVICAFFVCQVSLADEKPDADADKNETGHLVVALETDGDDNENSARILIVQDGKVVGVDGWNGVPVQFKNLPAGQIQIIVQPVSKHDKVNYAGESKAKIEHGKQTIAKVPVEKVTAHKFNLTILNEAGTAMKNTDIDIWDITDAQYTEQIYLYPITRYSYETDEKGGVTFFAFPGRKYRAAISRAKPFLHTLKSKFLEAKNKDVEFIWKASLPPSITFVFVTVENNKKEILNEIKRAGCILYPTEQGFGCNVTDGKMRIEKGVRFLKGAKKMTVHLNVGDADRYKIVKNGTFELDDTKDQVEEIILERVYPTGVLVNVYDKDSGKQLPKVYIYACDMKQPKILKSSCSQKTCHVPPGNITVFARKQGYSTSKKEITIEKDKVKDMRIDIEKASVVKAKIVSPDGTPLAQTYLSLGYLGFPPWRDMSIECDKEGKLSFFLDENLKRYAMIRTLTPGYAPRLLLHDDLVNKTDLKITLTKGHEVRGEIDSSAIGVASEYSCFIASKSLPNVIIDGLLIEKGMGKVRLEDGDYILYFIDDDKGVQIGDFTVAGKTVELGKIKISVEQWQKAIARGKLFR